MISRSEDVVLVISPSLWSHTMYSSGVVSLSAYLEDQGIGSVILDSKLSPNRIPSLEDEQRIIAALREMKPRVVGFSASHREFAEVVRLNRSIKTLNPEIITIVGGSQATYRAADFLNNGFDFVCRGEGEKTLHEFVQQVFAGIRDWGGIAGLSWRYGDQIVTNPDRQIMTEGELNSVRSNALEKLDSRYFDISLGTIRGLPLRGGLLLTSRGCPFACCYCGCNLIFGRKLRMRSLENIEREIAWLKNERQVEGVWIVDDTFTIDHEHAIAVASLLKKYGMIWGCQSRVNSIDETLILAMNERGCVQIDFGVESGSQRILDEVIGKKISVAEVKQAFNLAKKHGLRTLANFMLGLPGETVADLAMTEKLADEISADVYIFCIATPLPGTRLYDMVEVTINPDEYALLNWNGSPLTARMNKSLIPDLVAERDRLYRKYIVTSFRRSLMNTFNYRYMLTQPGRMKRIGYAAAKFSEYLLKVVRMN